MGRSCPRRVIALGVVVCLLASCSLGTPSQPAPQPVPTAAATPSPSAGAINLAPEIQTQIAGTRRVELEIGGDRQRVEIELPVDHPAAQKSRVAFRPGRWTLFPAA